MLLRARSWRRLAGLFREKPPQGMAFPHQDSREDDSGKVEVLEEVSVGLNLIGWEVNIADEGSPEDDVNPAKDGTLGGIFHDFAMCDLMTTSENGR